MVKGNLVTEVGLRITPRVNAMNIPPVPPPASADLEVGVASARLLLRQALRKQEAMQAGEEPELARKRALKELTGASLDLPAKACIHDEAGATQASEAEPVVLREIVTIRNARPDE